MISNLPPVPASVVINGPVVLDKAGENDILYPDMNLRAPLAGGQNLQLFFIDVVNPHLGFSSRLRKARWRATTANPKPRFFQTPNFYLGTDVFLTGADGQQLAMALQRR